MFLPYIALPDWTLKNCYFWFFFWNKLYFFVNEEMKKMQIYDQISKIVLKTFKLTNSRKNDLKIFKFSEKWFENFHILTKILEKLSNLEKCFENFQIPKKCFENFQIAEIVLN